MHKLLISLSACVLTSCAFYSHETMVSTFVLEGGLNYYQRGLLTENIYKYEVQMWEKSPESGDIHEYRTDTQEHRMITANYLLTSKYHTGCEKIEFISEESFLKESQPKKWLNGRWWKVLVSCENPLNPRASKYG